MSAPVATNTLVGPRSWVLWVNPTLIAGLVLVLLVIVSEWILPVFIDTDQIAVGSGPPSVVPSFGPTPDLAAGFVEATSDHPLGTDSRGRDMLAVLAVGTPRTLKIGLIGAGLGTLIGIILGFSAGYMRGKVDTVLSTLADTAMTIPGLAVLVVVASVVDEIGVVSMGLIMAAFAWPMPTRVLRSQVLTMRDRRYVVMARMSGTSTPGVMFKEIMPNLLPYLAASLTESVAGVILAVTSIETLGLGSRRLPTLGTTVNNALEGSAVFRGMWWWWLPPIFVLAMIFVGFLLLTIGLDQVANPRLRDESL